MLDAASVMRCDLASNPPNRQLTYHVDVLNERAVRVSALSTGFCP